MLHFFIFFSNNKEIIFVFAYKRRELIVKQMEIFVFAHKRCALLAKQMKKTVFPFKRYALIVK